MEAAEEHCKVQSSSSCRLLKASLLKPAMFWPHHSADLVASPHIRHAQECHLITYVLFWSYKGDCGVFSVVAAYHGCVR
eukprot:scaffold236398_cov19-Tisochrysis_lutea.AAC.1